VIELKYGEKRIFDFYMRLSGKRGKENRIKGKEGKV